MVGKKGFVSCTPAGIIQLLKRSNIEIAGKHCVVIGRSNIVGKPMALLMLREKCNGYDLSFTDKNLKEICKEADILIVAIGKPRYIGADYIKEGAVVIDVGIHRNEDRRPWRLMRRMTGRHLTITSVRCICIQTILPRVRR